MRIARTTTALLLATVALGASACGGGDGDGDEGAATTAPPAETTAAEPAAEVPEELEGPALEVLDEGSVDEPRSLATDLEAADGTTARVRFEDGGPPQNYTGEGQCDGTTFDQAATVDEPSSGKLTIEGVGTADLAVSRVVTVIAGTSPPPCEERIGAWTGEDGSLAGRTGSFTIVTTQGASQAVSTLTLREE